MEADAISISIVVCGGFPRQADGGGGIRTHGALARPTVFKTVPFDRSGTPPLREHCGNDQGGRMLGYIIATVEIHDEDAYGEYRKHVPATIAAYGGRFVVRGGAVERLEGDWEPHRLVVLEFPSVERAREWWASEEYREPKALRQAASTGTLVLVEGYEG